MLTANGTPNVVADGPVTWNWGDSPLHAASHAVHGKCIERGAGTRRGLQQDPEDPGAWL